MIQISNLNKFYGQTQILHDINLHINKGEIYAIVGHSGAGKSTLLRCINGLEKYQNGSLKVFDMEISKLKANELRNLRRDVGMIFQHFALMSRKSVFENVATPLRFWGMKDDFIKSRVNELLNLVGLESKATSYPNALSGGQKQRVAIARALALSPKILLSDEATSALDPNTTNSILELLKKINKELGISIVIVTHEMEVVKTIAHKAMLLEHGNIIGNGKIEDLFLKPDEKMKHFLGEDEILPQNGVNIRLYFPKEVAQNSIITSMARELNIDFNIVWGKLEKLGDNVLGNLVINVSLEHLEAIEKFVSDSGVIYEIVK
ncbi:Methionine import ATP-binding protein MetN [Campylobacter majalis]|uniref:Methionine import ATP-binding protein MetN n=1 Tax=Campylobacter majalis TaxID=2790656 RepID=A0ABN7K5E4_9BACT|nr:methionine ABC transporter ATP-binding protein [Campylobacter majalis]CAD7287660.1 Methionine import ATP-binding protein MetN [Campylobacter majalis]